MANKKTQRDYFKEIIALAEEKGNAELVAFAQGRIEMLDKKAGSKKPTKTQAENVAIKDEILATLTSEGATVTEIQAKSDVLGALSNQKVSALLRQMVDEGLVTKTVDKKKSYFALAE